MVLFSHIIGYCSIDPVNLGDVATHLSDEEDLADGFVSQSSHARDFGGFCLAIAPRLSLRQNT